MTVPSAPSGFAPGVTMMAQEIAEQPTAVARTLETLMPLRQELRTLAGHRRRVLLVARGSSDNAAVYGRYLLETRSGIPAALSAPSVATHYRSELDLSDTLVVALSQSGGTDEIVATQHWARRCGAATVAITNDEDSPLAKEADIALVTRAGRELAVPATKSYTTQLAALAVLATALAPEPELEDELLRVPGEMAALLETPPQVQQAVDQLAGDGPTLVVGRGLTLATALEVALKLEETCLRPVRGLSYADLRHGPIAMVSADTTAIVISAPDGPLVPGLTTLASDLRQLGTTVIGIGGNSEFRDACEVAIPGPALSEPLAPLGLILPPQLAIEKLARRLGLDPDAPRGLAKVTQTDRV
ncbi:SIS domain-containing protein [Streptomyces griseorubiginosus]|uniref:SIS domain-containing protein n=1 Tax=Streptomyces griseorubiginosus TaxID=67304 RepID=UPI00369728BF